MLVAPSHHATYQRKPVKARASTTPVLRSFGVRAPTDASSQTSQLSPIGAADPFVCLEISNCKDSLHNLCHVSPPRATCPLSPDLLPYCGPPWLRGWKI